MQLLDDMIPLRSCPPQNKHSSCPLEFNEKTLSNFVIAGKDTVCETNYLIILDCAGGELSGVQYKSQMINTLCSTK